MPKSLYHIFILYLSCNLSFHSLAFADVKTSGYQRQSAIALDRYDPEDRALRELFFEVERRMRLRDDPWRPFRRRAWEIFSEDGNRTKENHGGKGSISQMGERRENLGCV